MDQGLITLIVAILAFIPGVLSILKQWKKDKEDARIATAEMKQSDTLAAEKTVQTALSLVTPLKERIAELEKELKAVVLELKKLETLLKEKEHELIAIKRQEEIHLEEIESLKVRVQVLEHEIEQARISRAKWIRDFKAGKLPEEE